MEIIVAHYTTEEANFVQAGWEEHAALIDEALDRSLGISLERCPYCREFYFTHNGGPSACRNCIDLSDETTYLEECHA